MKEQAKKSASKVADAALSGLVLGAIVGTLAFGCRLASNAFKG